MKKESKVRQLLFSCWVSERKKGKTMLQKRQKKNSIRMFPKSPTRLLCVLNWEVEIPRGQWEVYCDVSETSRSGSLGLPKYFCLSTSNLGMFIDDNSHSPEYKLVNSASRQQMLLWLHCHFSLSRSAVSGSGFQILWPEPTVRAVFYILTYKYRHKKLKWKNHKIIPRWRYFGISFCLLFSLILLLVTIHWCLARDQLMGCVSSAVSRSRMYFFSFLIEADSVLISSKKQNENILRDIKYNQHN